MNALALLISSGASFLFLWLVFRPLEVVFPARPGQRFFRSAWATDLCFFLGQYLLWNGLMLWVLSGLSGWFDAAAPSGFRASVGAQPLWLQAIEVVFLSD